MDSVADAQKDKLVADFKMLLADTEELLRITANQAGDKAGELRARVQEHVDAAKAKLGEADSAVRDSAKAAVGVADEYVRENPWRSVGIAAGIGVVLGLLLSRR
jgi:ElaB/YqjD/DUF883 family membrane-anchored ribosome-binding protein